MSAMIGNRLAKLEQAHQTPVLGRFIVVAGVTGMDAAISVLAERQIKVTPNDMVLDEPGEGAPTVEIINVTMTHEQALAAMEKAEKGRQHVRA